MYVADALVQESVVQEAVRPISSRRSRPVRDTKLGRSVLWEIVDAQMQCLDGVTRKKDVW